MRELKADIKSGLSKDRAFASFKRRGGDAKRGARYLAILSEPAYAEKYVLANNFLIAIYLILLITGLSGQLPQLLAQPPASALFALAASMLLPVLVLYFLYKKNAIGYWVLALFSAKGVLDSFAAHKEGTDFTGVGIAIAINLLLLVFAVSLKNKIFPYQSFFNTKKDKDGHCIYQPQPTDESTLSL